MGKRINKPPRRTPPRTAQGGGFLPVLPRNSGFTAAARPCNNGVAPWSIPLDRRRHLLVPEILRLPLRARQTYRQIYRQRIPLGRDRRRYVPKGSGILASIDTNSDRPIRGYPGPQSISWPANIPSWHRALLPGQTRSAKHCVSDMTSTLGRSVYRTEPG